MTTTIQLLADLIQGRIEGDADLPIVAARAITEAGPGDITFVENENQVRNLEGCQASAVIVPLTLPVTGKTLIRVKEPLSAFIRVVEQLHGKPPAYPAGIDERASIHPTVSLGADVTIHPFVSIGAGSVIGARCQLYPGAVVGRDCTIGDDSILYPQAVLYDGITLGKRVIVHAHAVVGADGFGYRFQAGKHVKVPQLGNVEIGDDVEIGACSTIDRGTFSSTRIANGTKIDNLVMIAHNCQIGAHNILVSQVGIAGSSSTGSYVVIAGQAGVADHIHVGDGVMIGACSAVTHDLPNGGRYLGVPAIPDRDQKRIYITTQKLPEMRQDIQRIKRHLGLDQEKKAC